jgi:hypothetical protein
MRLESLTDQVVPVAGRCIAFQAGETIHTEKRLFKPLYWPAPPR